MIHEHQHLLPMPDTGGMMLLAGSWGPILAIQLNAATIGLLMSILVSLLAVIDYGMKIYTKAREIKEDVNDLLDKDEDNKEETKQ